MVKRNTVLMILITTVLALSLTVYGEKLEASNHKKQNVLEERMPIQYNTIEEFK